MSRIGILGGTFNPVHIGHLLIAERAREQFCLDKVWFMPCGMPYMKDQSEVLPPETRCELTGLAIAGNPFFELSLMEAKAQGPTYTYETLSRLHEQNPDTAYFFLLGADSLWNIERWKEPAIIFANCHILAAVRNDRTPGEMEGQIAHLKEKYQAEIDLIKAPGIEVSSTMLRSLVKKGKSIRYLVPEAVREYIMEKGLYR